MRFVLAIVSFVAAALLIGLGIAQKTILAEPNELTASASISSDAPVTVISGETLNTFPRSQFVQFDGSEPTFAAYGRTVDVLAWIGDASYNTLNYDAKSQKLVSTLKDGEESELPSPVDSDLWLASYADRDAITINVPEDVSLLVMADGVKPAPTEVSVTWPLDNSTPWANTFVVAGGVLLLLGLLLLFWAIAHIRKGRGPRRKSQKMPKMPKLPRPPRYKQIKAKPRALEANAKGRRSMTARLAIMPVVLVGALTLGGCSADFWAGRASIAAPTPAATAEADAEAATQLDQPAVTVQQANRIIRNVAEVAAAADAAADPAVIATRVAGPALELRLANYQARKVDPALPPVDAFPDGDVALTLPARNDTWPRTVLAVVDDKHKDANGATLAPVAVVLIQDDARANYKAHYLVRLEPGVVLPDVAPASVGATTFHLDSPLLAAAPEEIPAGYSDVLLNHTASPSYERFEPEGDSLQATYGQAFKQERIKGLPTTSSLAFATVPATGSVVALSTNDSGAIVAVNVNESETVKPVAAGAVANAAGAVKALAGKDKSAKGFVATFGYQILFFVPSAVEGGKITMLGYSQGIIAASELP